MKCDVRHRTWRTTAECLYPTSRVRGDGRFAVFLPAVRWDLILFTSQRDALKLYSRYQHLGARFLVLARHGRR